MTEFLMLVRSDNNVAELIVWSISKVRQSLFEFKWGFVTGKLVVLAAPSIRFGWYIEIGEYLLLVRRRKKLSGSQHGAR